MGTSKITLNILYFLTVFFVIILIFLGNRGVTVFSENIGVSGKNCIVIDPGHGGEDGGASSCTGRVESAYNLEIALRLNDLCHFLGIQTRMIRTTDRSVYTKGETIAQKKVSDLKERVRICNETPNAILISIHQNIFADSRYSGAQVFYAKTEGSSELARQLQENLKHALQPTSNRQMKKANGIYLMEHISCTGVLIECGFLSNPGEEAKLRDENYQKMLCCVIGATAANFLDG